jgi:RNase P/RNase MRP subunit POP5
MKRLAPPIVLWLMFGSALAWITSHVADWFVMTDELLYERLALSVDRLHSPVPHVHGVVIANLNQLYPLLLAPVFATGTVADGLHRAHVLNAFVVTSAAIPTYLLALRVTRSVWASTVAAALTVAVPWLVLSSFLLTETVAYPAFVWALLAFHVAVAYPSRRHDALAALALVVAITARTQFIVLALVLALMIAKRWREHRVLVAVYAVGGAVALVLLAAGHNPLGTYSSTTTGNPLPAAIVPSFFAHLAAVAVGLGLVPFIVGGAWLLRRDAFATLALSTTVALTAEVASYNVRFGGGLVRDRYIYYLAPVFAIAFAAALASWERPSWKLGVPVGVLAIGFAKAPLPIFDKLNVDTPVSIIDGYLLRELGGLTGARIFLVVCTLVTAALAVEAGILLGRRAVVPLAALALVLATAETGYAFERLFRVNGTAGRPLTVDPSSQLAWVDRIVGRNASVTMVPYPIIPGDYWSSAAYWWDMEFWNVSAERTAGIPGTFEWTPSTFPKLALTFDNVGRTNVSPPGDVLQAVADTRFHIAGTVVINNRSVFLVDPERPWRADWTTTGFDDDGWTRPGVVAKIRIYAYPGQDQRVQRRVTVSAFAPSGVSSRPLTVGDARVVAGENEVSVEATVCVPPNGSAALPVRVDGASPVYGNPSTELTVAQPRLGGVQISRIDLSGHVGPSC